MEEDREREKENWELSVRAVKEMWIKVWIVPWLVDDLFTKLYFATF